MAASGVSTKKSSKKPQGGALRSQAADRDWWDEVGSPKPGTPAGDALAEKVLAKVREIEDRQQAIHKGNRLHAELYAGYVPANMVSGPRASILRKQTQTTRAGIRSTCDTATALIAKVRPKPTPITEGADFELQQAAHDLDKFLVGAYAQADVYSVAQRCFLDSTVFGTGVWKLVRKGKEILVYRVQPDNLVVDELECYSWTEPRNWYEYRWVHVGDLKRDYPDVNLAPKEEMQNAYGGGWATHRIPPPGYALVVEAYHIEGNKSVRVLSCNGRLLEAETWPHAFSPYVVIYWSPPLSGFYGDGIAYRQCGRQIRVNYMYRWVHRVQELIVAPRIFTDAAGGPPKAIMSNEIGQFIQTRGKVQVETPQGVTPEIYSWLDNLEQGFFEDEGISVSSASNQLPAGIESAPAQREYSYKEGTRFAPVSQRYENALALETAYRMIAMYAEMAKGDDSPSIKWLDRGLFEVIDWDRVADIVDGQRYRMRVDSSSLESLTPSARSQHVIELSQAGAITPEETRRYSGFPDLERNEQLDTADYSAGLKIADQLAKGEDVEIDPYLDLKVIYDVVRKSRAAFKNQNAPAKIIEHMSMYLDALDAAMAPPPAPAMPGAPGEMPPPGMPGMEMGAPMGPDGMPAPGLSAAAAQGLDLPFSQGGQSREGV